MTQAQLSYHYLTELKASGLPHNSLLVAVPEFPLILVKYLDNKTTSLNFLCVMKSAQL